jgi:hypothetical protein
LVVQATVSGTLNGEWCSVRGSGPRASFDACVIFRFDDEARIVSEEHYSDALTVLKQVGAELPIWTTTSPARLRPRW